MGEWYEIGRFVGFGVALGVFAVGIVIGRWTLVAAAVGGAAAMAFVLGLAVFDWDEGLGGFLGGLLGGFGVVPLVGGAFRRGGTRLGLGIYVALAALVLAALAFVPGLGYVEALAAPALAARLRRRAPERYAGLRTLARD